MYYYETDGKDAYVEVPDINTPIFKKINLILQTATPLISGRIDERAEVYETGLLTYGNANPESPNYNSLADFCFNNGNIEIRLPWQLLNFSAPSEMTIHDDYYEHYGVENIKTDKLYLGIGSEERKREVIKMNEVNLIPWGKNVTYHERLKKSYYIVQSMWAGGLQEN